MSLIPFILAIRIQWAFMFDGPPPKAQFLPTRLAREHKRALMHFIASVSHLSPKESSPSQSFIPRLLPLFIAASTGTWLQCGLLDMHPRVIALLSLCLGCTCEQQSVELRRCRGAYDDTGLLMPVFPNCSFVLVIVVLLLLAHKLCNPSTGNGCNTLSCNPCVVCELCVGEVDPDRKRERAERARIQRLIKEDRYIPEDSRWWTRILRATRLIQ